MSIDYRSKSLRSAKGLVLLTFNFEDRKAQKIKKVIFC